MIWVIMRQRGYPQNAGVLVVLVQHWDGAGMWNLSLWKPRICLIVHLAYSILWLLMPWRCNMQGAKAFTHVFWKQLCTFRVYLQQMCPNIFSCLNTIYHGFALRVSGVPARHYVFASKLSMTDIDLSEADMLWCIFRSKEGCTAKYLQILKYIIFRKICTWCSCTLFCCEIISS